MKYSVTQLDLWANDMVASEIVVAEHDGFTDTSGTFIISHTFFLGQLAPDGKVYICSADVPRVLSTIDFPDR